MKNGTKIAGLALAIAMAGAAHADVLTMEYTGTTGAGIVFRLTSNKGQCRGEWSYGQADFTKLGGSAEDMCWTINKEGERLLVIYDDGTKRAFPFEDLREAKPKYKNGRVQ